MSLLKKILVVEDEKPLSKALELKMTHSGFEVRLAYDGEEALELLRKEDFDLILLDLVLPKKSGFDVLLEMRKRGIKTPVIAASNLSQREDINKVHDAGADGYFVKSDTSIAMIIDEIKRYLKV